MTLHRVNEVAHGAFVWVEFVIERDHSTRIKTDLRGDCKKNHVFNYVFIGTMLLDKANKLIDHIFMKVPPHLLVGDVAQSQLGLLQRHL